MPARIIPEKNNRKKIRRYAARSGPISITAGIIVGFPGETEYEFEETRSLLDEVQLRQHVLVQVVAQAEFRHRAP